MKKCSECKIEKEYINFHKNKTTTDGYQRICKECKRKRGQSLYQSNKKMLVERNKNRKLKWRKFINSFKPKCSKCNETCKQCLDFHHLHDKEFGITKIAKQAFNERQKNRCKKEIDKCIVLCANCHRKVHFGYLEL